MKINYKEIEQTNQTRNSKKSKYVVYAHRGASAYAPENTMASFRKAVDLGANGMELDLQKTKDGKIVIFHDDTIDNKSNKTGKICDYTYSELLEMDFGSWFNEKYKGEKIVLFEYFAEEFLNKSLTFAIELKVLGIEKETLEIINKYSKDRDNIYITSFLYEVLENVRKIDKTIKLSYLVSEISDKNIEDLLRIKGNQICPRANNVTKEDIIKANNYSLGVRLWGINSEEIMKKVYKLEIEGMTVNFPDKLIKLKENNDELETLMMM